MLLSRPNININATNNLRTPQYPLDLYCNIFKKYNKQFIWDINANFNNIKSYKDLLGVNRLIIGN